MANKARLALEQLYAKTLSLFCAVRFSTHASDSARNVRPLQCQAAQLLPTQVPLSGGPFPLVAVTMGSQPHSVLPWAATTLALAAMAAPHMLVPLGISHLAPQLFPRP